MHEHVAVFYHYAQSTLAILVILFIMVLLSKYINRFVERLYQVHHKHIPLDETHSRFLQHLLTGIIYFIGLSLAIGMIPPLRNVALSMLASSGIIAVIVGFASQQAFSNIISGFFLDIFRPFEIGNRVSIGKQVSGTVEDITLRHTVIKTAENNIIMIPNSTVNSEIIENTSRFDQKVRASVDVFISYNADINRALGLLKELLEQDKRILKEDPYITAKIVALDLHSIHLKAWFWAPDLDTGYGISFDAYEKIKESFDTNNIQFAHASCTCISS